MESFFYATLGVCVFLIALRALIFLTCVTRKEGSRGLRGSAGSSTGTQQASNEAGTPLQALHPALPAGLDDREAKEPNAQVRSILAVLSLARRLWPLNVFYGHGLTGKMIIIFTAIIAAFGVLTIATVYLALTSSLKSHAIERASVTALNISYSVPARTLKKDISNLRELLRKHTRRPGVAYVLIENRAGEILVHSFAVLPEELKRRAPIGAPKKWRTLEMARGAVYEVAVPVLEGQSGAVRLGIWRDEVDAEIFRTIVPVIKLIMLAIGISIFVAIFLAWKINRPIRKLVQAARSISGGDLDTPSPGVEDTTEFGELSRALERMRSSVKAAMVRLGR